MEEEGKWYGNQCLKLLRGVTVKEMLRYTALIEEGNRDGGKLPILTATILLSLSSPSLSLS